MAEPFLLSCWHRCVLIACKGRIMSEGLRGTWMLNSWNDLYPVVIFKRAILFRWRRSQDFGPRWCSTQGQRSDKTKLRRLIWNLCWYVCGSNDLCFLTTNGAFWGWTCVRMQDPGYGHFPKIDDTFGICFLKQQMHLGWCCLTDIVLIFFG